jgi:hypothetical protein
MLHIKKKIISLLETVIFVSEHEMFAVMKEMGFKHCPIERANIIAQDNLCPEVFSEQDFVGIIDDEHLQLRFYQDYRGHQVLVKKIWGIPKEKDVLNYHIEPHRLNDKPAEVFYDQSGKLNTISYRVNGYLEREFNRPVFIEYEKDKIVYNFKSSTRKFCILFYVEYYNEKNYYSFKINDKEINLTQLIEINDKFKYFSNDDLYCIHDKITDDEIELIHMAII